MTAPPPSGAFMMVDQAHVALLGAPAAVLFARIAWRSERDGSWAATYSDAADETGLPLRAVRTATALLRERGWITTEQSGGYDRTTVWTPVFAGQAQGDVSVTCMSTESSDGSDESVTIEVTETVTSSTQTEETMRDITPDGDPEPLPMLVSVPKPVDSGPPKTAQTLVARWCDGYRATNGHDAPGPMMKRVAGQMRNLAKACESDADWSAAWAASYAAGEAGRCDAVPMMAARRRTGRRNVFNDPALGGMGADAVEQVQAMINGTSRPPLALGGRG